MGRPITARQFALILWVPVLVALAAWGVVTLVRDGRDRSDDRAAATQRAAADTDRAGRQLQRDLDALNAQTGAARQAR